MKDKMSVFISNRAKKMVEKLKYEIRLPIWAITIIVTLLLAMAGYSVNLAYTVQQVRVNTESIKKLDNKVDKEVYKSDIQDIKASLNSINAYLLNHTK